MQLRSGTVLTLLTGTLQCVISACRTRARPRRGQECHKNALKNQSDDIFLYRTTETHWQESTLFDEESPRNESFPLEAYTPTRPTRGPACRSLSRIAFRLLKRQPPCAPCVRSATI